MFNLASILTHTSRRWKLSVSAFAVAVALAMCGSGLMAQSGAGSIQGTVTDSTGAVIPGATIHVINDGTNVATDTTSNNVGFYQVPALFTGSYTVTIGAPSMKTYKTTVQLLVAQAAVINPVLVAGAVTQQVEVAADAMQLSTTDNGTITSTLERSRINQLPMNGRLLTSLTGAATPGLEAGGTRGNGLMGEALEYVADGVSVSNRQFGGMSEARVQAPDPDAVQQVQLEMTGSGAQYATPATAIVTTKSGTNSMHGSFFETARNNGIGIAKGRQNPSSFIAPHYVRNEFGGSAGGPIVLPHMYHGKDKSFWFFAYERYSLAQSYTQPMKVQTNAMRAGDFSGLVNGSNVLQQLYDPLTTHDSAGANCPGTPITSANPAGANTYCRTAFPGNKIPANRESPFAKTLFAMLPPPTSNDNPLVTNNLNFAAPINVVAPNMTGRLDHVFTENDRAYLRFSAATSTQTTLRSTSQPASLAVDGFPAAAGGLTVLPSKNYTAALGFTHVFSPTFFSETIFSQQWFSQHNLAGGSPFTNFEKMLGLPNNFGETGFPQITGLTNAPTYTMFIYGLSQTVWTIDENLTKTIGKNQMQFGGRYRLERFSQLPDQTGEGPTFGYFSTALDNPATDATLAFTGLPNTASSDADAFLGTASKYTVNQQPPRARFRDMEFDAYFQDNWHATRNLTVNLGLRWEGHPAPWTSDGLANTFDLKNDALVTAAPISTLLAKGFTTQAIITNMQNIGAKFETPQQAGIPATTLLQNYNLTFSPRVGLAYQPFGGKYGTVIRGAYGRYIYPMPTRSELKNSLQNTPLQAFYSQDYNSPGQSPDGIANYMIRKPLNVIAGVNSANAVDSTSVNAIPPGLNNFSNPPNMPPDFVTETDFTIEQPLKGNSVLRVSWIWTHGTNLDQWFMPNNQPSGYVWQMAYGVAAPNGGASTIGTNKYAATATGPYDQVTWGGAMWQGLQRDVKSGWSNDNALQVNYQRLFHHGVAYQIFYVWSKPLRVGGNSFRDNNIYPRANYLGVLGTGAGVMTQPYGVLAVPTLLPPPPPAGMQPWQQYRALNAFQNYKLDPAIPLHHVSFNGIVDLPFGRGKHFLGNANRFLDELVGGFQLAGDGNVLSQVFQPSGNWGPNNPIKVYKHNAPVTDCRSGVCHKSYDWFNGYVAPTSNSAAACTNGKCVSGLPSGWVPFTSPMDNTPGTTYYGQNMVAVTLLNGTTSPIAYNPGPAATGIYNKTFLLGPFNYTVDLSLFKVFPITERVNLRFNMDAFNALNMQGYNNPNTTDGTEAYEPNGVSTSYNTPRQVQFTLRLSF